MIGTLVQRGYRDTTLQRFGNFAYWRMSECSGAVMGDATGIIAGTYVNTPDLGVLGALSGSPTTAVNFKSASSEYAGGDITGRIVDTFTVSQWIQYPSTPVALQCFFSAQGTNVWLFIDTANKVQMWKANSSLMWTTTNALPTAGGWVHVVATKDGATTTIYINGAPVALTGANQTLTASALFFLSSIDGASFFFNGAIEETAVYTQVLTAAEVASLYQLGRGF